MEYPLAAESVNTSFYVDDGLTGADSVQEAIELQGQLKGLFSKGSFLLELQESPSYTAFASKPQGHQFISRYALN